MNIEDLAPSWKEDLYELSRRYNMASILRELLDIEVSKEIPDQITVVILRTAIDDLTWPENQVGQM